MTRRRISRDPGPRIKAALRREVNFGCPARFPDGSGCGCPILTYHHFDPPWREAERHDVAGMVALCPTHHAEADGGVISIAQLRDYKSSPVVQEILAAPWPWLAEALVMQVGPNLVIGHGNAMTLAGRSVMHFRPVVVPTFGHQVVEFNADVRDASGAPWLHLQESWFDLRLAGTTDAEFRPQTRALTFKHADATWLRMTFSRLAFEDLRRRVADTVHDGAMRASALARIEATAMDRDGQVPFVQFEGQFSSPHVAVEITDARMHFQCRIPGLQEEFDWTSYVVDGDHNVRLALDRGPVFFTLG